MFPFRLKSQHSPVQKHCTFLLWISTLYIFTPWALRIWKWDDSALSNRKRNEQFHSTNNHLIIMTGNHILSHVLFILLPYIYVSVKRYKIKVLSCSILGMLSSWKTCRYQVMKSHPKYWSCWLTLHVVGEVQLLWRNGISHFTADTHSEPQGPKTTLHV